jgi:hypothetical protein
MPKFRDRFAVDRKEQIAIFELLRSVRVDGSTLNRKDVPLLNGGVVQVGRAGRGVNET